MKEEKENRPKERSKSSNQAVTLYWPVKARARPKTGFEATAHSTKVVISI